MENHPTNSKKRVRENSADSEGDSAEAKRLRDDLLEFLDDSDLDPATQDLDSVMKSFEEEIAAANSSPAPSTAGAPAAVVDLTTDSGESNPDLGYLLGASDDELGLPPSETVSGEAAARSRESELVRVPSDSSEVGDLWRFDDHAASYGSFDLGSRDDNPNGFHDVAFDGLFENSDVYFDSSDFNDFSWRFETLPAQ